MCGSEEEWVHVCYGEGCMCVVVRKSGCMCVRVRGACVLW